VILTGSVLLRPLSWRALVCEQNCETAVVSWKRGKIWSMINHHVDKTSPSIKTGLVCLLSRTSFVEQHKRLTFSLDPIKFSFNICTVQATLPLTFCSMKVCLTSWRRNTDWTFYILLTVHHAMILGKWPTWRTNSFICIYFYF
jgi:hypothetical protein